MLAIEDTIQKERADIDIYIDIYIDELLTIHHNNNSPQFNNDSPQFFVMIMF